MQNITAQGYNKTLYHITSGSSSFSPYARDTSSMVLINRKYQYPISFYQSYTVPFDPSITDSTLYAELDRSLLANTVPILPYLTSPAFHTVQNLVSRQKGSCIYYWNNTYYEFAGAIDPAKDTFSSTERWFSHMGPLQEDAIE